MNPNPALRATRALVAVAALCASMTSQAALFEDAEARRAILDLRERVQQQSEEIQQLRRSLIEQQNQTESVRGDLARLRGEKEELLQDLKRQQGVSQVLDERIRKFEPTTVKVDGVEFVAEQSETRAYNEALAVFRSGDFKAAANAFQDFVLRQPRSGYLVSAYFWLGNAQYANREYKDAIKNFSSLIERAPSHVRAPDALLSIANCQIDLKDLKSARKTLEEVVAKYPQSEAAGAAKERLGKLK